MKKALLVFVLAIIALFAGGFLSAVYQQSVHENPNPPRRIDIGIGWVHPAKKSTLYCNLAAGPGGAPFLSRDSTPIDSCLYSHNAIAESLNYLVFIVPIFIIELLIWLTINKLHSRS